MRKLASLQKITAITPIENADRIELVHVLGWQCVAGKGEFHVGEMVVYFEIDSFLPICDEFEFLRKTSYRNDEYMGEGFKLITMKFRGEISQGLCLGIHKCPQLADVDIIEGLDVSKILGVREWETLEYAGSDGTIIGDRPGYIAKTDETRIQSMPGLLQEFEGKPYYISTKMDGSSHSVGIRDGVVSYTGHEAAFKDDGKSGFVEYIKARGIPEQMQHYMDAHNLSSLVLQGEWCGPGIQKNRLKLTKPEWFVFTTDINGKRTDLATMQEICESVNALLVPIEETGDDLTAKYPDASALLARADGIGYNNTAREGIVIRPITPVHSQQLGGSLSMKVLNNRYLMKNED